MYTDDARLILTDPTFDRNRRLLRLQGQRGPRLEQAVAAGWAIRLGPAQCAAFGALAILVADPGLYLALAFASTVGAATRYHPVEWLYSWWTVRQGRVSPPPNRAGRRFGCLLGAVCFFVAGVALAVDAGWLFWPNALLLVALPAYVAVTNLCVPSLILTLLLGSERAACPSLPAVVTRQVRSPDRGLANCFGVH